MKRFFSKIKLWENLGNLGSEGILILNTILGNWYWRRKINWTEWVLKDIIRSGKEIFDAVTSNILSTFLVKEIHEIGRNASNLLNSRRGNLCILYSTVSMLLYLLSTGGLKELGSQKWNIWKKNVVYFGLANSRFSRLQGFTICSTSRTCEAFVLYANTSRKFPKQESTRKCFYKEMWPLIFILRVAGLFPYYVSSSGKLHMRWVKVFIYV
jgi:hypothetical protein